MSEDYSDSVYFFPHTERGAEIDGPQCVHGDTRYNILDTIEEQSIIWSLEVAFVERLF